MGASVISMHLKKDEERWKSQHQSRQRNEHVMNASCDVHFWSPSIHQHSTQWHILSLANSLDGGSHGSDSVNQPPSCGSCLSILVTVPASRKMPLDCLPSSVKTSLGRSLPSLPTKDLCCVRLCSEVPGRPMAEKGWLLARCSTE